MKESVSIGTNKTGIKSSPKQAEAMKTDRDALVIGTSNDKVGKDYKELRGEASKEWGNLGSVPPPLSLKGVAKTGVQKLSGNNPEVLIDMIGERIAFEKGGVRLYEMLIEKCEAFGHVDDITEYKLDSIREDEAKHVQWLIEIMEKLGGDPTAMTPGADAMTIASAGIFKVLGEPRSTLTQAAQAILTAELTDNDGWHMLVKLARQMGLDDEAKRFETAYQEEQEHLLHIRKWLDHLVSHEAKVTLQ